MICGFVNSKFPGQVRDEMLMGFTVLQKTESLHSNPKKLQLPNFITPHTNQFLKQLSLVVLFFTGTPFIYYSPNHSTLVKQDYHYEMVTRANIT